jgi:hypothetical protein
VGLLLEPVTQIRERDRDLIGPIRGKPGVCYRNRVGFELSHPGGIAAGSARFEIDHLPVTGGGLIYRVDAPPYQQGRAYEELEGCLNQHRLKVGESGGSEDGERIITVGPFSRRVIEARGDLIECGLTAVEHLDTAMDGDPAPSGPRRAPR